jgi:hypothetical protein
MHKDTPLDEDGELVGINRVGFGAQSQRFERDRPSPREHVEDFWGITVLRSKECATLIDEGIGYRSG